MAERTTCRDHEDKWRLMPFTGVADALKVMYDLNDHPKYGETSRRMVKMVDGEVKCRIDVIKILDTVGEIEEELYGRLVVPGDARLELRGLPRCATCRRFTAWGRSGHGWCDKLDQMHGTMALACSDYNGRD